jgi:hypothetical protein
MSLSASSLNWQVDFRLLKFAIWHKKSPASLPGQFDAIE